MNQILKEELAGQHKGIEFASQGAQQIQRKEAQENMTSSEALESLTMAEVNRICGGC